METIKKTPTIKEFKHRSERKLRLLGYSLTILTVIACLLVIFSGYELDDWTYLVFLGLLAPLFGAIFIRFTYYKKVRNGVEVSKKQLPELYKLYEEVALQMGFTQEDGAMKIPPLYVVTGFGIKIFLSSKCASYEQYIVLKSDFTNLLYGDEPQIDALKFIIAHELAHIKCQHISMKKLLIYPIMKMLFLDKSLARAEEYTADRVACYYMPECIEAMIKLHIQSCLGEQINVDEYFNDVDKYHNNLFLRGLNFMSNAVEFRRIRALREVQINGWNVHGKMY